MHRRLALAVLALVACRGGGEGKQAVELLADVTEAVDLAVDQTGVYLATKDSLVRIPLTGGEPVSLARGDITAVAVDPSYIYYVQRQQERKEMEVHRLDKDGGNNRVVASDWPLIDLASDDAHVYWTGGFRVRRLETDGSVTELAETGIGSYLAFDDDHVYYSAGQDDRDLFRVPKSGGRSELIVSNRSKPSYLAAGGGTIYWIEDHKSVGRAPIGGAPGPAAAAGTFISHLAWDRGDLFVIDSVDGTIRRVPPAGEPVVIARGENLWKLAIHGEHVYFMERPAAEGGKAPVRRVAR